MKLFQALKQRSFTLLWGGQSLSRLGDSLYQIALAWWVLQKTESAAAMGSVFIFTFLPKLVFGLLGGLSVDRFSRRKIMLASDILRGILTLGLGGLAALQRLELWHIYLASLVFGLVEAFFLPAYAALVPEIIPAELRPSANALTTLSAEFTGIAGPSIGALIIAWNGAGLAFALDGLTFFISALCLLPLLELAVPQIIRPKEGTRLGSLRAGFRVVTASTWLWFTIAILALLNLTGRSPMNVALPFLVKDTLKAEVSSLGLLYSVFSLGSIVGAIWLGRTQLAIRRGWVLYGSLVVVGVMTLALGLPITIVGVTAAIFCLGIALAVNNLVWSLTLQERVPTPLLGRVASINLLGSTGLLPLGFGLAGWATDAFGPEPVFVVGGLLTVAVSLIGLVHPAIRNLE